MSRAVYLLICLFLLTAIFRAHADSVSDAVKAAREAQRTGDYQRAKDLLTQALSNAESSELKDSRLVDAQIQLAELLLELGEYARCEALCKESIDRLQNQFGEKHLQIASAERILAGLYLQLEMSVLADQHCERGLKICESIHVKPHPDIAAFHTIMRQIWNIRSSGGSSGGVRESLEFLEKSFGNSDPRLIVPLEAIAGDCYDRWTPAEAARAVSIAETNYGSRHPVYGRCLSTYATALRHTRDFEQAEIASKQSVEILKSTFGPDSPQLSAAYRNLASIERHRDFSDRAGALLRNSIRLRFSTLSDAELCHFFEQLLETDQSRHHEDSFDAYLTEMTRRGGEVIEQFLAKKIESLHQKYLMAKKELEEDSSDREPVEKFTYIQPRIERYSRNLEFVTALCRIQKKPDPLQILVEESPELSREFPHLPVFHVAIRNVDPEKREIGFQASGDYRSGRQARWRIEAIDASGRVKPFKELHGMIIGGGLCLPTTLKPDEGWETALDMSGFVETLEPGEYQVRIFYHNDLKIADWEFVAGLLVCRSEPMKLTVKRRSIQTTKRQQQDIVELLQKFDDLQPCQVVDGKYGEWAHKFISADSDYGRLLELDWSAVPALIDELVSDGKSPERISHMLALLFSITRENNPETSNLIVNGQRSPLVTYSILHQGWSITSQRSGEKEPSSAGFGSVSGPTTCKTQLDANKQAAFIERWKNFKSHYEVILRE